MVLIFFFGMISGLGIILLKLFILSYLCSASKEAHSLWMSMLQLFGIDWVMPGSVADLLFCWYHWLGKHNSDIWNLVPDCLMWTIWTKRNRRSFEDTGNLWFNC